MLRPVGIHDIRFLRDMLRHAYHWRFAEDEERPVYRYVQNWGRAGDAGVMALDGPHAYGAAWYRLFTEREPGFGFVDPETPELTIAVVPSRRGKGAGKELLEALLAHARETGEGAGSVLRALRLRDGARFRARRDDARPPLARPR
jgi:GNAT superfamily N-acetyltransferase